MSGTQETDQSGCVTEQKAPPGDAYLVFADGYESALRDHGCGSLDELFAMANDDSLSKPGLDGWRERIRVSFSINGQPRTFYIKRFSAPPASARRACRRSGSGAKSVAGVEWTWLNQLAEDGIPCAKAVAFGEEFDGSVERRSVAVIEGVAGESLETWAKRWTDKDRPIVRSLIRPLANLVARLHTGGYYHRDLYLSHVFYDPSAKVEQSLCLIDLQRLIQPSWAQRRWTVKDLASLNYSTPTHLISNADRIRWLKSYLGIGRLDKQARQLLYRVVGKTRRIARHQRRRERRWSEEAR